MLISHAASAEQPARDNYRLAPDDLIEIKVFQEDDLSCKARIAKDGRVTLPLIGAVNLAGKSVEEAMNLIRTRYADGYLVNPQVNVTITEYVRRRRQRVKKGCLLVHT